MQMDMEELYGQMESIMLENGSITSEKDAHKCENKYLI